MIERIRSDKSYRAIQNMKYGPDLSAGVSTIEFIPGFLCVFLKDGSRVDIPLDKLDNLYFDLRRENFYV